MSLFSSSNFGNKSGIVKIHARVENSLSGCNGFVDPELSKPVTCIDLSRKSSFLSGTGKFYCCLCYFGDFNAGNLRLYISWANN